MKGTATSYRPEVMVRGDDADSNGQWVSNTLRFATPGEADGYLKEVEVRWVSVRQIRVVACNDPVNVTWQDGKLVHISA